MALPPSAGGSGWPQSQARCASALIRRRRRAYYAAEENPHTSAAKVKKLKERATLPKVDILRHIGENKIGKAVKFLERKAVWYEMKYKKYAPRFCGQIKPRMCFWAAAVDESQLPPPRLPEVAIAGRSNSGKSTLLNYLSGHHAAYMKRKPGSTTEVVFWTIGRPPTIAMVDLPGYGFAEASEEKRLQWTEFSLWYLRSRKNLRLVLLAINAQAGIKPTDREMIAYFERHSVPWQIVITKSDKVVPRELAKRITLMEDELSVYKSMKAAPIPVTALKRKGMDSVREVVGGLRACKEYIKDGIRKRVYNLLEERRIKNNERRKRRAERIREKEREARIAAAAPAEDGNKVQPVEAAPPGQRGDLHSVLADWGFDVGDMGGAPPIYGGGPADGGSPDATAQATENAPAPPKSSVTEAGYPLDDRDSMRMASLMGQLFPEMASRGAFGEDPSVAVGPVGGGGAGAPPLGATLAAHGATLAAEGLAATQPAAAAPAPDVIFPEFSLRAEPVQATAGLGAVGSVGPRAGRGLDAREAVSGRGEDLRLDIRLSRLELRDEDSDDLSDEVSEESDDDDQSDGALDDSAHAEDEQWHSTGPESKVIRFGTSAPKAPLPPRAAKKAAAAAAKGLTEHQIQQKQQSKYSSPFPGFGLKTQAVPSETTVGIRRGFPKAGKPGEDTIYEFDDVGSAADHALGIKRFAPPSPTAGTQGQLLADARRRYEREWATELEDVERARTTAGDSLEGERVRGFGAVAETTSALAPDRVRLDQTAGARLTRRQNDYTGANMGYITTDGDKKRSGRGLYKSLGRPLSRIMKPKLRMDVGKALNAPNDRNKKRNTGSGLDYDTAKDKWHNWFDKNKREHWHTVSQSPSPKLEDVEAAHAEIQDRRQIKRDREAEQRGSRPTSFGRRQSGASRQQKPPVHEDM